MKIVLVSKCFLDIEQYAEFKMSVLISPSRASLARVWSQIFNRLYQNIQQYHKCRSDTLCFTLLINI